MDAFLWVCGQGDKERNLKREKGRDREKQRESMYASTSNIYFQ